MLTRLLSVVFFFIAPFVQGQSRGDSIVVFKALHSYKLMDVKQQKETAIPSGKKPLSLFVFLSPECPLSQGYTRSINQLQEKYKEQMNVYGIIPGHAYSVKDVKDFESEYSVTFPLLIDSTRGLSLYLQAEFTPQAILLDDRGALLYSGAIDDWVISLGKKRQHVSQYYVQQAVEQTLAARPITIKKTNAIGCRINDY